MSKAVATRSAALIGEELVALFDRISELPDKVQWVYQRVAADLPGSLDPTLDRACLAFASAIDSQAPAFDFNPYHNRQHFCEVVLTAHALCFLNRLDAATTQFVLLAALIHDLVHDGGSHPAFVQERASVESARPALVLAGLDASQLDRLTAVVLATDTLRGTTYMAAACKAHKHGEALTIEPPAGAPELAALAADPQLALLARILCEADILPSIGLNLEHAQVLQDRLSREWRRPLDDQDKLAFMGVVLKHGYIGDFFLPNVQAMRDTLASRSHASDEG